jgi:hypothetical protein
MRSSLPPELTNVIRACCELLGMGERVRERALDLDNLSAHRAHLHELGGCDRARRHDDHRLDAGARRVGGTRRCCVPGRRADEPRDPALQGPRRRDRHAAVLERARRIGAFPLQPEVDAEPLAEPRGG